MGLKGEGGEPNDRKFGEACLSTEVLVETNPGAGIQHSHKNDIGHPDRFKCQKWCACQKFAKGVCVAVTEPVGPCSESAKCVCSN